MSAYCILCIIEIELSKRHQNDRPSMIHRTLAPPTFPETGTGGVLTINHDLYNGETARVAVAICLIKATHYHCMSSACQFLDFHESRHFPDFCQRLFNCLQCV